MRTMFIRRLEIVMHAGGSKEPSGRAFVNGQLPDGGEPSPPLVRQKSRRFPLSRLINERCAPPSRRSLFLRECEFRHTASRW
jgi:hypothetical protein